MKGIVFNLLETVVVAEHGEDMWEALLDTAKLDGSFTSLGSYPDGDMMGLVSVAARKLQLSDGEVLQWFEQKAMPLLSAKYPALFNHASTRPFLLSLNSIIHPEVRKLYPGADVPMFDFDNSSDQMLIMGYRSSRKLCKLAEGFVQGAARHFGESVTFEHRQCMHLGHERCVFHISFGAPAQ